MQAGALMWVSPGDWLSTGHLGPEGIWFLLSTGHMGPEVTHCQFIQGG
jgi:hypothetical protein